MTAIVEVQHLQKVYPPPRGVADKEPLVAVEDLSFRLESGGSIGIVGESGAGKSTVAKMLVGLERPTAGRIQVAGRERTFAVTARERKTRAREMQMVFQDPSGSLDPRQTVEQALDEVLRFHCSGDKAARSVRIEELMEQMGLSARHRRSCPRAMSGGQRQRVAIARALAADPSVLILDESVAALDVSIQAQILNLLAELRREIGVSYIWITHDLGVVRYATDDLIVMRGGRVVESGATRDVLDAPAHPYTSVLKASVPGPGWTPRRRAAAT